MSDFWDDVRTESSRTLAASSHTEAESVNTLDPDDDDWVDMLALCRDTLVVAAAAEHGADRDASDEPGASHEPGMPEANDEPGANDEPDASHAHLLPDANVEPGASHEHLDPDDEPLVRGEPVEMGGSKLPGSNPVYPVRRRRS